MQTLICGLSLTQDKCNINMFSCLINCNLPVAINIRMGMFSFGICGQFAWAFQTIWECLYPFTQVLLCENVPIESGVTMLLNVIATDHINVKNK